MPAPRYDLEDRLIDFAAQICCSSTDSPRPRSRDTSQRS